MELTPLRYFLAIAEAGHMTRAAASLGVTQPALSAAMKRLEAEVGLPLLDRTGRGVELTEAGRVFRIHAREAIARAEAGIGAVRELAGLTRGEIRVGAGATAVGHVLPVVVERVHREHPGLTYAIREMGSGGVARDLLDSALDLGIVTLPIVTGSSAHDARDLMTVASFEDELRLIVPEGHRLAKRRTFDWADIESEPVVGFEAGSAVRELLDQAARAAGIELDVVMELRSIDAIQRMVRAGIGVGFVSRLAAPKGLRCKHQPIARTLAVVRRRDKLPSPALGVFETELLASLRRLRSRTAASE